MTLPVVGGRPRKDQLVEMAQKKATIVDLRLRGFSFPKIATVVNLHPMTVAQTYYAERGTAQYQATIERHRIEVLAEIEHITDVYRPHMYKGDGSYPEPTLDPPEPEVADRMIEMVKLRVRLLGAEPPKQESTMLSGTVTHEVTGGGSVAEATVKRVELLMELLADDPLGQQEVLDVVGREVGAPTGDSTMAPGLGRNGNGNGTDR